VTCQSHRYLSLRVKAFVDLCMGMCAVANCVLNSQRDCEMFAAAARTKWAELLAVDMSLAHPNPRGSHIRD
jgi:hypothetical protein